MSTFQTNTNTSCGMLQRWNIIQSDLQVLLILLVPVLCPNIVIWTPKPCLQQYHHSASWVWWCHERGLCQGHWHWMPRPPTCCFSNSWTIILSPPAPNLSTQASAQWWQWVPIWDWKYSQGVFCSFVCHQCWWYQSSLSSFFLGGPRLMLKSQSAWGVQCRQLGHQQGHPKYGFCSLHYCRTHSTFYSPSCPCICQMVHPMPSSWARPATPSWKPTQLSSKWMAQCLLFLAVWWVLYDSQFFVSSKQGTHLTHLIKTILSMPTS